MSRHSWLYSIALTVLLVATSLCEAEDSGGRTDGATTRLVSDLGYRRAGQKVRQQVPFHEFFVKLWGESAALQRLLQICCALLTHGTEKVTGGVVSGLRRHLSLAMQSCPIVRQKLFCFCTVLANVRGSASVLTTAALGVSAESVSHSVRWDDKVLSL